MATSTFKLPSSLDLEPDEYAGSLERQGVGFALAHLDSLGSHPTINKTTTGMLLASKGAHSSTDLGQQQGQGQQGQGSGGGSSIKGTAFFSRKGKGVSAPSQQMRAARGMLVYPPGISRPSTSDFAAQEAADEVCVSQ
jgi:hypothetical protein